MKKPIRLKAMLSALALSSMAIHLYPATAASAAEIVTCVDLNSGKERIAKAGNCRANSEATAKWHLAPTDTAIAASGATKTINICSNKKSTSAQYQIIRNSCAKHMQTNLYTRSSVLPAKPVITGVSSSSSESASLSLARDLNSNVDAPIAFYTITSSKGDIKKVISWKELTVTVTGLQSSTSYTFTISATSVDGASTISGTSQPVTTQRYIAPVSTTLLTAPAFSLSAGSETVTVNSAATGFTISSTGGSIASFGISATPAGMSFNTTTGALTGTPTVTQSATSYTITANNASGSATRTFILTVTAIVYTVGQTGPGGGKIFYVAASPFTCGPTSTATCTYLEVTPALWNAGGAETTRRWANTTYQSAIVGSSGSAESAIATAIGSGYRNTRAVILQGNTDTATSASALSDSYTATIGGAVVDDWYLPSKDELNQMCKWARGVAWTSDATVCSGGTLNSATYGAGSAGFESGLYWSSTEATAGTTWLQTFFNGDQYADTKFDTYRVRPIRAF